jgi:ABC-type transport system involved in multi-copper enzyme maturation permease subunit
MSIHSRRYQRYDGPIEPMSRRFLVITETETRRLWSEKWVRRLFIMAWVPVIYFASLLYLRLVVEQMSGVDALSGLTGDVFLGLFKVETWSIAVLFAAFGSSMINRDVSSKALTLYFTRPLNVDHYLWGKLLTLIIVAASVTFVPATLLAIAQLALSVEPSLLHFADIMWRVAATTVVTALLASTVLLLMSSLAPSSRFVGFLWLAAFILLEATRGILRQVLGPSPYLDLISIRRLFDGSSEFLIGGDFDRLPALVAALAVSGFCFFALRLRLKALEDKHT